MKVVIPVGALHVGGGCKVLVETAHALQKYGHDVEMVIPQHAEVAYPVKCKLTKVPDLKKEYIPYGDVILPNFYTTFKPAFEAWPRQCIRFSLGFEPLWVPDRDFALWTYHQNVPVISISNWLNNKIYQATGRSGLVVNLGVDPNIFSPAHPKVKPYRNGRKVIMYIARDPNTAYRLKGYEDFIKAMRLLKRHYKGKFIVHMVCTEVDLKIKGIPHRNFKPQSSEQMARLYQQADLFVSTSWFEGFSIPPLEAMACGTPVVTTNSGGILNFCQHLQNAYIARPRDHASIAKGMYRVLKNPTIAKSFVQNGLQTASRLTNEAFEENIVRKIESIAYQRNPELKPSTPAPTHLPSIIEKLKSRKRGKSDG
ncbi:glycosyltransferase family 4 protein [Caldalkalibacillus salinus]|uniref:glycosyltransferase family 4 protein n=1 Tax=Caldalkalibacillus salinus TaxID=2803787 RepID=UPI00192507CA|nr:glycosyltransferase family 4 protein [Caldalkalibacillus salinus]